MALANNIILLHLSSTLPPKMQFKGLDVPKQPAYVSLKRRQEKAKPENEPEVPKEKSGGQSAGTSKRHTFCRAADLLCATSGHPARPNSAIDG